MKENKDWLHGLEIDKKNEKKENKEKGTETPKLKKNCMPVSSFGTRDQNNLGLIICPLLQKVPN